MKLLPALGLLAVSTSLPVAILTSAPVQWKPDPVETYDLNAKASNNISFSTSGSGYLGINAHIYCDVDHCNYQNVGQWQPSFYSNSHYINKSNADYKFQLNMSKKNIKNVLATGVAITTDNYLKSTLDQATFLTYMPPSYSSVTFNDSLWQVTYSNSYDKSDSNSIWRKTWCNQGSWRVDRPDASEASGKHQYENKASASFTNRMNYTLKYSFYPKNIKYRITRSGNTLTFKPDLTSKIWEISLTGSQYCYNSFSADHVWAGGRSYSNSTSSSNTISFTSSNLKQNTYEYNYLTASLGDSEYNYYSPPNHTSAYAYCSSSYSISTTNSFSMKTFTMTIPDNPLVE